MQHLKGKTIIDQAFVTLQMEHGHAAFYYRVLITRYGMSTSSKASIRTTPYKYAFSKRDCSREHVDGIESNDIQKLGCRGI